MSRCKVLNVVLKDEVEQQREDPQQFSVSKDMIPVEQQDWNFSVDQEEPGGLHIKEEHEEFPLTGVPVKNGGSEEKPQSSHLHHTEENREVDPRTSSSIEHMKIEEEGPEADKCLRQDIDDEGSREDPQQFSVGKDVVPVEQQDWNFIVDQEDPDALHIKEEHDEFSLTGVPGKNVGDKEKPQSSHLRHTEENREDDPRTSGSTEYLKMEEDDPEEDTCLRQDTDDEGSREGERDDSNSSDFWKETRERQSGLKTMRQDEVFDLDSVTEEKSFLCSDCGSSFHSVRSLNRHKVAHRRGRCSCLVCGKSFIYPGSLTQHMLCHTNLKSFSCGKCDQRFTSLQLLKHHECTGPQAQGDTDPDRLLHQAWMLVPVGDVSNFLHHKCSHCGKRFQRKHCLIVHQRVHTREKPFSCSLCAKPFAQLGHVNQHMRIHTREKPFSCGVCQQSFMWQSQLRHHQCPSESNQTQTTDRIHTEA
ncbi:zinc finger protein 418-like isoform X4 [Thalassophryne amazonica]|uniref:zinc finger protein 418-like isoform X4 n=1 Tax=Thalassophryne amazonica TaxID=390379 RepID=UPI00147246A6|nr:zinc finger protein 418-like isoform X4 [Thalassophryne amazonica]